MMGRDIVKVLSTKRSPLLLIIPLFLKMNLLERRKEGEIMTYGPELVYAWCRELLKKTINQRITKAEGAENWVTLRFSQLPTPFFVTWDPRYYGCGWVTNEDIGILGRFSTGKSRFVEALKSHLLRCELIDVKQLDFDRVLVLSFSRTVGAGFHVQKKLVIEFMERNSNMILLDENNVIIDCAKHIHPDVNRYRTIAPSYSYVSPPPLQGRTITELSASTITPEVVSEIKGLGKGLRQYISEHWAIKLPSEWMQILNSIYDVAPRESSVMQYLNSYLTIFPFLLLGATPVVTQEALHAGRLCMFYPLLKEKSKNLKRGTLKLLKKETRSLKRHLQGVEKQKREAGKADWYKNCGDLILANIRAIPYRAGMVRLSGWSEEGEISLEIPLDPDKNPSDNAAWFFKKYKKAKVNLLEIEKNILKLKDKIEDLEEQIDVLSDLEIPTVIDSVCRDIQGWVLPTQKKAKKGRKEAPKPPHLRIEYEDAQVLVGLNAKGNRHVTFREAGSGDIWLHVHEIPGSHVIIKGFTGTKEDLEGSFLLLLAASLAAYFSKARHTSKVQIDYTERKHVRHIPGGAPAHVTYTHPFTVMANPMDWKEFFEEKGVILEEE